MFVGDWLAFRNRATPHRRAIYDDAGHREYTCGMLYDRAAALSHFLFRTLKVQKGDRIAVLSENRIECFELFFAGAKVGGIFLPLNTGFTSEALDEVVADARPRVLFYSDRHQEAAARLESLNVIPHLVKFQDINATWYERPSSNSHVVEEVEICAEDPLSIVYVSGESGRPRGVISSHGMVMWNSMNTILSYRLTQSDCAPLFLPLWRPEGLAMFTLPLLHAGGAIIIPGEASPASVLGVLQDRSITILALEPNLLEVMADDSRFRKSLAGLRFCISTGLFPESSGDKIDRLVRSFSQGLVIPEAGPNNFFFPEGEERRHPGSVGCPLVHVEAAISDSEGKLLNEGEEGELLIRGHHIFSGYWNNPAATRRAFLRGWLRPGVRARCEDGYYYIMGIPPHHRDDRAAGESQAQSC